MHGNDGRSSVRVPQEVELEPETVPEPAHVRHALRFATTALLAGLAALSILSGFFSWLWMTLSDVSYLWMHKAGHLNDEALAKALRETPEL